MFFWIIVSLLVFSFIVIFHELGHFLSARFFWVKVEEFWLGIPPRAKKLFYDKYGTLFSLNWLPLWGFVRLKWEQIPHFELYNKEKKLLSQKEILKYIEDKKEIFEKNGNKISKNIEKQIEKLIKDSFDNDSFIQKNYFKQSIIILGWVFMNFLLAGLIFSLLFFVWTKPVWVNTIIPINQESKLVPSFEEALKSGFLVKNPWFYLSPITWSIAENAGIQEGDILEKIEGIKVDTNEKAIEIIQNSPNKQLKLEIKRDNKNITLTITPSEEGKIGCYIGENIAVNQDFKYKYPIGDAFLYGFQEMYVQSILTGKWIALILGNIFLPETPKEREEALQNLSGPIGIVGLVSEWIKEGWKFIFILGAVISINLGVFNLLPIPALDGWRFIFICINAFSKKIIKKSIPSKLETSIHIYFFLLLIALSIIITYNDINKLISK